MPKNSKSLILIFAFIISFTFGCQSGEQLQLLSKDEAEREFNKICKEEYQWNVNTTLAGNTLWIYLPYKKEVLKLKANMFAQPGRYTISHLKGNLALYLRQIAYCFP